MYKGSSIQSVVIAGTEWSLTGDSANGAALVVTMNQVVGKVTYLTLLDVVVSSAAPVGDIPITLSDADGVFWKGYIGAGAPRGERTGFSLFFPYKVRGNLTLNVAAGGAGVITTANMLGYALEE